jgi:hypothetical protein
MDSEKLAKALRCQEDLISNGLAKECRAFRSIFGFNPKTLFRTYNRQGRRSINLQSPELHRRINKTLSQIRNAN